MKTILSAIGFLAFIFLLGTGGGLERGTMQLGQAGLQMLIALAVMAGCAVLATKKSAQ